ncbi:ABC transporter ATP-binding protein [Pigmentiphaga kullae]|uniref:Amino acid/amide ABC transporter ATP-binding protein 2 (HAAT family) n=1 Tax=Pigmentiphaga kullae TaxID=151784 RepID=A0A4Q7NLY1_9BURK|nr:ABC transporter ATP-binding protein [Pigmentiphaga kullae]RZS85560.1 amino acid/amide ABC transporter ATP-binding protein 2 (HAAT family) [Pigmentiphaga kullae]
MTEGVRSNERTAAPLLSLRRVEAAYGTSQALFGVDLEIHAGECVALLGRNGMGKSTTVKSIMGLLRLRGGDVEWRGRSLRPLVAHQIARAGLGLVPEGRRVFPNLTVRENLLATARPSPSRGAGWSLDDIYGMFPRLRERERNLGCHLSGGEQQMLAIGRALMTAPELLILDEATEGLAPLVRGDIWRCIELLKRRGLALLVIDKNLGPLMRVADRHYILEKGAVVWRGSSQALRDRPELVRDYIGM